MQLNTIGVDVLCSAEPCAPLPDVAHCLLAHSKGTGHAARGETLSSGCSIIRELDLEDFDCLLGSKDRTGLSMFEGRFRAELLLLRVLIIF